MIRLCTGITADYVPRALPYLNSMRKYATLTPPTVFAVNFPNPMAAELRGLNTVHCRYQELACQVPKFMLQHGGFTRFAPVDWMPADVIIFTDADAVLQRAEKESEINQFFRPGMNACDVYIGYNQPDHDLTLEHEADCLRPKVSLDVIEQHFPGFRTMLCRNTGFVATSLAAWGLIYEHFGKLAASGALCFGVYAWVQFVICYIVQRHRPLRLVDLPLSVHAHGHVGLHEGVHKVGDVWLHNDDVIYFAHVL